MMITRFSYCKALLIFLGTIHTQTAPLSPIHCCELITRGVSHIFNDLHMNSAKADGAWAIFKHRLYGNLADLLKAAHINLSTIKFTSPYTEYFLVKTDILSPKFWIATIACIYITKQLAGFCYQHISSKRLVRRTTITVTEEFK